MAGVGADGGKVKLLAPEGAQQANSSHTKVAGTTLLLRKLLFRFRTQRSFYISGDGGTSRNAFACATASDTQEQSTGSYSCKQALGS